MGTDKLSGVSQPEAALAQEIGSPLLTVDFSEEGKIIDFLNTRIKLEDEPEERRRQQYLKILHFEYGYPKDQMRREVPINIGSSSPIFADIVVYNSIEAARSNDQGQIRFCVEVKANTETSGHNQLVSYVFFTSSEGAVWTNAETVKYYRRFETPEHKLEPWNGIPGPSETWEAVGRLSKSQLIKPKDIKGLLRRCHQKLFRAGIESEDLAMDMVRIILAKWRDEVLPDKKTRFYCTPEEYRTTAGKEAVGVRVRNLFAEVRDNNLEVFAPDEDISSPNNHITEVVSELQRYRLLVDEDAWWDVLGAAYEQYTAAYFRQTNGQFFTNRLVVRMMLEMSDPTPDDVILDPAGGSGGFITASLRHVRKKLIQQGLTSTARQQLFDQVRRSVGLIEKANRLVKVAKTAAILTGDGHDNFYQGDSLRPLTEDWFPTNFLGKFGQERPTLILTNPPYAGTTDGKIGDDEILKQFDVARVWKDFEPIDLLISGGVPPELLFLERTIKWLKPGGRIAIVIARGMLDTATALSARKFLLSNVRVRAVISLHKDTFEPYTGVKTCVLLLEKPLNKDELNNSYQIFMAISRKIGQDSEGVPIFKLDEKGHETEDLDHDLDEILHSYNDFKNNSLKESEFIFKISKANIERNTLSLNPQHYLPAYNDSIKLAIELGERENWNLMTIGNLDPRVFKGARFKRQNLETAARKGECIEPFYTPAALLQDRADSVKYLDLSRANKKQRIDINKSRAIKDEILITRSGTIGRIVYVTEQFAGSLISDDLIHVRVEDEDLRSYVYLYLKSALGQHQMLRNEYGSVQQHLEPQHVRDIIIPIPLDKGLLKSITEPVARSITAKTESWKREFEASTTLEKLMSSQ